MGYLDLNGLSHYHTKITSYITTKLDAVKALIPIKTSQITNDSDFVTSTEITNTLTESKSYTDTVFSTLTGGALPEALDTLKEIASAVEDNADLIDAIQSAVTNIGTITTTEIDTLFTT